MKKTFLLLLCLFLVCAPASGCASGEQGLYTVTYLDLFDTVTTVSGRAESPEAFDAAAQAIHDSLLQYHQLFDIYREYEGLVNLKTVNSMAGKGPVTVDARILRLLRDCRDYCARTRGTVNIAMGGVLRQWHQARTDALADPAAARLPDPQSLALAGQHTQPDAVALDEAASTVSITDPMVQLDVGAIAKGWAVEQVAKTAPAGFLISVGGNICATGPKAPDGAPWVVGIQDPEGGGEYLHTLRLTGGSIVTSGDYQRAYTVDGKRYHHIIDPQTLYPGELWRSVTVICSNSAHADALSTALFLLPLEEGLALLEQWDAHAMWVDASGARHYSPGFSRFILR